MGSGARAASRGVLLAAGAILIAHAAAGSLPAWSMMIGGLFLGVYAGTAA